MFSKMGKCYKKDEKEMELKMNREEKQDLNSSR